ncbi:fungal hydrophobin [Trametes polyzona]|nr:fungal hydrophobin [Trametes polyzona]
MSLALRLLTLSGIAILATASPTGVQTCTTGPIQCCNQVASAGSSLVSSLLGVVGELVQDLNLGPIGVGCSPITGVGVGTGNACSAVTVCCENNAVGTLISIGCIPIFL